MKKFILGLLVGCLITFSTSVFAEEISMVGKVIQGVMPLYIDGQRAEKDLIVVDGTSYAPMRAASDLFGYTIEYVPEIKEVTMKRDIIKSIKPITIKNKLKPNLNSTDYLIEDNEMIIPISSVGAEVAQWDGSLLTMSLYGNTVTGTKDSNFVDGDPVQLIGGQFYIKISALGLKGTLQNGELTIE